MAARKGISLIELIMAIALGSLLLGLALVNMKPARSSASGRSLADSLAEELRLAGRSAVASGVPVAVALPTRGSGPHCQSLYTMSGLPLPQMTRVRNYTQEFSGTYLCVGTWPRSGSGSWTRTQPQPMSNSDTFNPSLWANPVDPLDPTLIFTPAGTVTSNGLPLWNGDYYLVASQGVEFQPTTVPGSGPTLNAFTLRRLAKPWTLRITPTGVISVLPGLTGSDGTTPLDNQGFASVAPPAPPLSTAPANTAPTITACQVTPEAPDGSAAGVAVLAPEEHLSLRVTASDAQNDRIYCSWTGSDGTFSSPIEDQMEWDGTQWVSHWEWRPPAGVQSGSYTLTCTVRDARGAATSGGAQGSLAVSLQTSGTVIFGDCSNSVLPDKLKRIHLNGSGETEIPRPSQFLSDLKVSPNGERFYFSQGGMLYSSHSDGRGSTLLSFDPITPHYIVNLGLAFLWGSPNFSPQGTQLVVSGVDMAPSGGPSLDLFLIPVQGGVITRFTSNDSKSEQFPFWSGDGQLIVYESEDSSGDSEVMFKPASGGPSQSLTAGLTGSQQVLDLCPTLVGGKYRLLYCDRSQTHQVRVLDFDTSGSVTPVGTMVPSSAVSRSARISRDGTRVTYRHNLDIYASQADGSGNLNLSNGPAGANSDDPAFTPDGTQVVFWSHRDPTAPAWNGDLFRARVDGTSVGRITRGNQVLIKNMVYSGWDISP